MAATRKQPMKRKQELTLGYGVPQAPWSPRVLNVIEADPTGSGRAVQLLQAFLASDRFRYDAALVVTSRADDDRWALCRPYVFACNTEGQTREIGTRIFETLLPSIRPVVVFDRVRPDLLNYLLPRVPRQYAHLALITLPANAVPHTAGGDVCTLYEAEVLQTTQLSLAELRSLRRQIPKHTFVDRTLTFAVHAAPEAQSILTEMQARRNEQP